MRFLRQWAHPSHATTMDMLVHDALDRAASRYPDDDVKALKAQVDELVQLVAFLACDAKPSTQRIIATANEYKVIE